MTQTIITAGDATVNNVAIQGGDDGTMVLKVGAAGSKVNALSFAADGTATFLRNGLVLSTTQSLTGTVVDFTGVPSWAKRVTVSFVGASTNGSSNYLVQLGTDVTPTWVITNYKGSSVLMSGAGNSAANFSSGFLFNQSAQGATCVFGGDLVLKLQNTNVWQGSGIFGESDAARGWWTSGSISLGAVLSAIRITTANGTDVYDAGSVSILYEG